MWCDQAKSVWSLSNSVFIFLTNCMYLFHCYILQKTPLKLEIWFQRYEHVKKAKNNRKQKMFSALFDSIIKSIFPTSDWFCLITSHMYSSKFILSVLIDPFLQICTQLFSFANLYPMTPILPVFRDPFLKCFVPNDPIFIPVLYWTCWMTVSHWYIDRLLPLIICIWANLTSLYSLTLFFANLYQLLLFCKSVPNDSHFTCISGPLF